MTSVTYASLKMSVPSMVTGGADLLRIRPPELLFSEAAAALTRLLLDVERWLTSFLLSLLLVVRFVVSPLAIVLWLEIRPLLLTLPRRFWVVEEEFISILATSKESRQWGPKTNWNSLSPDRGKNRPGRFGNADSTASSMFRNSKWSFFSSIVGENDKFLIQNTCARVNR